MGAQIIQFDRIFHHKPSKSSSFTGETLIHLGVPPFIETPRNAPHDWRPSASMCRGVSPDLRIGPPRAPKGNRFTDMSEGSVRSSGCSNPRLLGVSEMGGLSPHGYSLKYGKMCSKLDFEVPDFQTKPGDLMKCHGI